jgi:Ca2+/Na+ antiporter
MITSYVLIFLSGAGLILIGINHYVNIWPTQHISFDLFVSLIFIATQTLIIFFFVGTGVNIKDYTLSKDNKFYKGILSIKRRLYPPTLAVTILFMITVIIDGAFFLGKVNEWWFHISYVLTLYYFVKSSIEQHKAFIGSTNIVIAMTENERGN